MGARRVEDSDVSAFIDVSGSLEREYGLGIEVEVEETGGGETTRYHNPAPVS